MKCLVKLCIKGYNLDQLLNKIQSKHIVCYNIARLGVDQLEISVKLRDYKQIKNFLNNYQYSIKYLGLSNLKGWIFKNIVIIAMLPIMVGLAIFSTRFVWDVRIYGVNNEMQMEIEEILKDYNIAIGKNIPKSNAEIEKLLLTKLPNVAQVSCIRRGTTIIINVSEKLVYTEKEYEPIYAKYDGIITNFNLISGTMAVHEGDFVKEGDVLVYPFTLDKNGNQVKVKPIAEIKAKAYIVGKYFQAGSTLTLSRTGNSYTTSSISLWNKNLFSKKDQKVFDIYETSVYNENISSVIPLIRTKTTYYELRYVVVNHNLDAERQNCEKESKNLAYKQLPSNTQILDEQTNSLIIQDNLYCTTTLTILTIIS